MPHITRLAAGIVFVCFSVSLVFSQIPITISGQLPSSVDNSTAAWCPPIVDQGASESCANATGIGFVFSYESNALRKVSGKAAANQYPFSATFDFLNNGDGSVEDVPNTYFRQFLPAWRITQENGIPSTVDFGTDDLGLTSWLSGYDKYYRAMSNRVAQIDSFALTDTGSLRKMKQWLKDHGNGAGTGGVFVFTANIYGTSETTVPAGTPEGGKVFVRAWGSDQASGHCMAIVGYSDSVRYDLNGDGRYTNNLDISTDAGALKTTDGKVDMADWEIGAFKVANSWGTGEWNGGYAWAPYRSFVISPVSGGTTSNNRIYYCTIRENYSPRAALKVSITDSARNTIALSVGVAMDPAAQSPLKMRRFERQFTYSGGALPMCGRGGSRSIELGLDVSDLLDSLSAFKPGKFFLIIDSKGGKGTVDSLSLMDYTSGSLRQIKSSQIAVAIAAGSSASPARTYVGVGASTIATALKRPLMKQEPLIAARSRGVSIGFITALHGPMRASLVDMRGRECAVVTYTARGQWVEFPGVVRTGCYMVKVESAAGAVQSVKVYAY